MLCLPCLESDGNLDQLFVACKSLQTERSHAVKEVLLPVRLVRGINRVLYLSGKFLNAQTNSMVLDHGQQTSSVCIGPANVAVFDRFCSCCEFEFVKGCCNIIVRSTCSLPV